MALEAPGATIVTDTQKNFYEREGIMWWAIGFGGILWIILAVTLGVMTIRNGHGWLFFFGIFFPILWIFGAFMRPAAPTAATY